MSRSAASRSRASHSDRTAASARGLRTRCMPEVRRHGSARGAGGGAVRTASNSCARPLELALLVEQPGEDVAQLDQHLDVQRGVDEPVLGEGTARPVGRAVPLLQREPEQLLHHRAEPDPRQPGEPPGQLGVEQLRRARARPRRGRAGPGWRRAAPTPARCRAGASARQVAAAAGSGRPAPCRHPRGAAAPGRRVGSSGSPMPVRRRRRSGPVPAAKAAAMRASAAGSATTGGSPSAGAGAVVRSAPVVGAGAGAELSDACVSVSG